MSSIRRNCTTISRKTQAMYHRENRKQRVIAKAFGVSDEVFNSGGGWGNNGKSFCNYLTAQDKKAGNARNSLSAHKTTQKGQHKVSYVAISPTMSVATTETISDDSAEDDSGGGDSDSDQPEPPRSTHLTTPIPPQRNKSSLSWQSSPSSCSMSGGAQI